MKTNVISINNPNSLIVAVQVLQSGGVVAFPTDTVYGIAVPVMSEMGINKLYAVKGREASKAIAVLVGNIQQMHQVVDNINRVTECLIKRFWPGGLTIVMRRHANIPNILSPLPTIGVRMPDYDKTLMLLKKSGPLATTSANLSGSGNPLTADEVMEQLGGKIELILDGGKTPGSIPSTVIDCTVEMPVILRQGAISQEEIFLCLSENGIANNIDS